MSDLSINLELAQQQIFICCPDAGKNNKRAEDNTDDTYRNDTNNMKLQYTQRDS